MVNQMKNAKKHGQCGRIPQHLMLNRMIRLAKEILVAQIVEEEQGNSFGMGPIHLRKPFLLIHQSLLLVRLNYN